VQLPRGPAAVNGDETRRRHCLRSYEYQPSALRYKLKASRGELFTRWEGTGSRVNHEPEDLLGALTVVPSRAGERVRMKKRVQSSRSVQALGIFSFDTMAPISPCHPRAHGGAVGVLCAGS
jgi:hypothetical protein